MVAAAAEIQPSSSFPSTQVLGVDDEAGRASGVAFGYSQSQRQAATKATAALKFKPTTTRTTTRTTTAAAAAMAAAATTAQLPPDSTQQVRRRYTAHVFRCGICRAKYSSRSQQTQRQWCRQCYRSGPLISVLFLSVCLYVCVFVCVRVRTAPPASKLIRKVRLDCTVICSAFYHDLARWRETKQDPMSTTVDDYLTSKCFKGNRQDNKRSKRRKKR